LACGGFGFSGSLNSEKDEACGRQNRAPFSTFDRKDDGQYVQAQEQLQEIAGHSDRVQDRLSG